MGPGCSRPSPFACQADGFWCCGPRHGLHGLPLEPSVLAMVIALMGSGFRPAHQCSQGASRADAAAVFSMPTSWLDHGEWSSTHQRFDFQENGLRPRSASGADRDQAPARGPARLVASVAQDPLTVILLLSPFLWYRCFYSDAVMVPVPLPRCSPPAAKRSRACPGLISRSFVPGLNRQVCMICSDSR